MRKTVTIQEKTYLKLLALSKELSETMGRSVSLAKTVDIAASATMLLLRLEKIVEAASKQYGSIDEAFEALQKASGNIPVFHYENVENTYPAVVFDFDEEAKRISRIYLDIDENLIVKVEA